MESTLSDRVATRKTFIRLGIGRMSDSSGKSVLDCLLTSIVYHSLPVFGLVIGRAPGL